MTLWELSSKQQARVTSIHQNLCDNVMLRLSEMGIDVGSAIQCVRKGPLGGPIVMQLGGSVFAIEQDLASKIQIEVQP
ncbi:ferrous iron transport protein A [Alteromonas aestuariivivens]|uniref:Ferrous iron transport protein A n=1 Tax=Alteromonas aestuariivivens TaxID=1938339 RepID=A0A3D8M6Y6_9ALTE|nr:FeoA family protein [Alteromonas aestuariivivens]RDV25475.1 ferrous iron transport protein A [Alteromonas aestuariivivens]